MPKDFPKAHCGGHQHYDRDCQFCVTAQHEQEGRFHPLRQESLADELDVLPMSPAVHRILSTPFRLDGAGDPGPGVSDRPVPEARVGADAERKNAGKVKLSLVPKALIYAAARALGFGTIKYRRDLWRQGMSFNDTMDSLLRHLQAFNEGEDNDPESGYCHLDHAAANLAFLCDFRETHPERDDRYRPELNLARSL